MLRTLRPIATGSRQFASAAATSASPKAAKNSEISTGTLKNGIQIGSLENFGPVSTVSFVVNGSSRFETPDNLGVSHFLRLFGFKGVHGRTQLRLSREIDNHGGNLRITSDREKIVYTAEFLRSDLNLFFDLISGTFTHPEYQLHEFNEVHDAVQLDLGQLSTNFDEQVFDLLHKQAFRNGLGNSNYAPKVNIGSLKPTSVADFSKKHFVGGNIAVFATGVNFHDLENVASHLDHIAEGKVSPSASNYYGGELHQGRFDSHSRVAVAYGTKGAQDADKNAIAVLQRILGGQSRVSYGNSSSPLSKVSGRATVQSFGLKYSDAGLVGFFAKAQHGAGIKQVVDSSLAQIQSLANSVSAEDLARGKNQTKFDFLSAAGERSSQIEIYGKQLLSNGKITRVGEWTSQIDQVTASDVQKAASKLVKSTPTIIVAADDF